MRPRATGKYRGIQSADYQYINPRLEINNVFDYKGTKSTSAWFISNIAYEKRKQTNNLIIKFKGCDVTNELIETNVENVFSEQKNSNVEIVITIKNDEVRVFKR